jgi:hypothetical protein
MDIYFSIEVFECTNEVSLSKKNCFDTVIDNLEIRGLTGVGD